MSYLCPVCAAPFGGDESLADHLAVTAILHGGDHEAWLDDTVADWASLSRADLGERVADHAETADDHEHIGEHSHSDHEHGHRDLEPADGLPNGIDAAGSRREVGGDAALDADAQAIIEEARELTQEMQGKDEQQES
ncbi:MAG: hypothetical protein J07HN4v3_02462 [Halonotius sp. J07HN4]|nr:MAG: hypothetical protein J07HN4v3_02462 [Halonotius sp. J07HN4]